MASALRPDLARRQKQLDGCDNGVVITDEDGHPWQYCWGYWYRAYDGSGISSFELAQRVGKFTLLAPAPAGEPKEKHADTR